MEGTSTVDIGYHYVATDAYGNPLDTDGDGIPDYIEDANGNGTVDSGETDWQSATDLWAAESLDHTGHATAARYPKIQPKADIYGG